MKAQIVIELVGEFAVVDVGLTDLPQPERHNACVQVATNAMITRVGGTVEAYRPEVKLFVEGVFDGEDPRRLREQWGAQYLSDAHLGYLGELMGALGYHKRGETRRVEGAALIRRRGMRTPDPGAERMAHRMCDQVQAGVRESLSKHGEEGTTVYEEDFSPDLMFHGRRDVITQKKMQRVVLWAAGILHDHLGSEFQCSAHDCSIRVTMAPDPTAHG